MSWIQKLYETYECCAAAASDKPWPVAHLVKRAHVEVAIDEEGNFRRARKLERTESPTLIPATEFSAGRTRDIAPHPLCEELGYCAPDLPDSDADKQGQYSAQLTEWCSSEYSHPKVKSIRAYLLQKRLWTDLNAQQLFPIVVEDSQRRKTKVPDAKVFVRWRVEATGDPCSGTWEDDSLINAWGAFDRAQKDQPGICMVVGNLVRIGKKHPRFLRYSSDGAKLISANDDECLTFRGRFTDGKKEYGKQTCSVGFDVSQKAHNALRWLIERQKYRNGEQVIVSWAVTGKPVPDPFASTLELFGIALPSALDVAPAPAASDTAQTFALRLKNAIAGYSAKLDPTDDIVVMALDSATQGRMAITYYRELKGSEFLERIHVWHMKCAWPQNFGRDREFVGAPSPRDIAEAAYGRWDEKEGKIKVDEDLMKTAVERLLPCIVDGQRIPNDLVLSACRHATNRISFKKSESGYENQWEKCLGVACALFKGYHNERSYQMALEHERTTRDYLYGRLLAIADSIEGYALSLTEEGKKRDTTAARFMQRFADRPFSTWRNIELALEPYASRLKAGSDKSAAFLAKRRRLLDEVVAMLDEIEERTNDAPLTGEFLLGFHSQRQHFRPGGVSSSSDDVGEDDAVVAATSS